MRVVSIMYILLHSSTEATYVYLDIHNPTRRGKEDHLALPISDAEPMANPHFPFLFFFFSSRRFLLFFFLFLSPIRWQESRRPSKGIDATRQCK